MYYKIDENVPIPHKRSRMSENVTGIGAELNIGDSVLIEEQHKGHFYSMAKRHNIVVTMREISSDGEGEKKFRVWRIA